MNRVRPFLVLALLSLVLTACGSQSDNVGVPSLDGASAARSGIFEVDVVRPGGASVWTLMFSETRTVANPDRIVGYREDGTEFLAGRFTPGGTGSTRRANVLWFDQILVTPEPDPDADEDDPPPEPVLTRRVRNVVLDLDLRARESITGSMTGDITGTIDGVYARRRYERVSGYAVTAGIWENIDAVGRELLRLDIISEGGYGGRDIDDCAYSGRIDPINTRFNLYTFLIAAQCGQTLDATGLATILPPPPNALPSARPRLIAVVPTRDGSDVFHFDVERASN